MTVIRGNTEQSKSKTFCVYKQISSEYPGNPCGTLTRKDINHRNHLTDALEEATDSEITAWQKTV